MIALGVACFCCMALLDYALVRHQQAVAARSVARAGAWSAAAYLMSLVGAIASIRVSLWFVAPEVAGLVVGNVFALTSWRASGTKKPAAWRSSSAQGS